MKLKVAVLQLDIAFGDPEANIEKVKQTLAEIADQKPDLAILPELWTTGYDLPRLEKIADQEAERLTSILGELARKHNLHLIAGSVAKKTEQGIYNTLLAFNRHGEKVGEYEKAHLIRLMDEEKYMAAGKRLGLFELENIPCAGVICYDIRFPEWIRRHVLEGAQILFVPAEWPRSRLAHWKNLLVSRAIENQCYVIACNRVGSDPNNEFAGHSMVIDPWGEILLEAGLEETVLIGEIDLELVADVRSRIPIFADRRPELYT